MGNKTIFYTLLFITICIGIYYYSLFNNKTNIGLSELNLDKLEMKVDSLEKRIEILENNNK